MIRQFVSLIIPDFNGRFLTMFFPQKTEEQWRFAGGKVEEGELPIQAAARELKEELGVEATGLILIHETKPRDVDGDTWQGKYFLVQTSETPAIQETQKHSDLKYMDWAELTQLGSSTAAEAVEALEDLRDTTGYLKFIWGVR